MAEEEDFNSLPLPDRFAHKNWKVRKEGYEAAGKEFNAAQTENDPIVRQFILDSNIWKNAVSDSNVAAQQEALGALNAFLQIAGQQGCTRTRNLTITPIVEKGLAAARPAAKQKALELILLYIELDKPDPVIEELLPILSHKQPKIITATLTALISIYNQYGCRTVDPKPVLKGLPKVFGHADKNVRAEAQKLTVEFYRWLKDAMKPFFWNDLKPVQQQDLEKLFDKVKDEPPPKQERLLRSQQAVQEAAAIGGGGGDDGDDEDDAGIDLEPEYEAVDVMPKIPKDLQERLSSSKWKDRKEALEDLHAAINHPRIEEGHFDDIMRALAKCMKDANIAVVTIAANCIDLFARGLRKSVAKYRSTVMPPMMERLKEKKVSVTEAIGGALDAVFASTSLGDCLEDVLEFLKHKNPQVKLESTRFLIRCLKTTREAPQLPEVKTIAEAATKLLTESQEVQRSAGAEVLGTLWKIMGDRIMGPHLEGLDDIRKNKIKEYHEAAEVKAKFKPKAAAPPKPAPGPAQKKPLGKRPGPGMRKPAGPPAAAAPPPPPEPEPAPVPALAPKPTSRPGLSKLGPKGLAGPAGGLRLPKKGTGLSAPSGTSSPRKPTPPQQFDEPAPAPVQPPKLGLGRGGLAGRPLGKPSPAFSEPASLPSAPTASGLGAIERAELEELRAEVLQLRRHNDELRAERTKLNSQIHELQNQNAQLIEDHTRDVLSIKAKETQLVRARSDAEAAEQSVQAQQREIDRLKRELSRQVRATSPAPLDVTSHIYNELSYPNGTAPTYGASTYGRSRGYMSATSPTGEGKENFDGFAGIHSGRAKLSPIRRGDSGSNLSSSGGSGFGGRSSPSLVSEAFGGGSMSGAESWKRAAEVTQNLKARIELMKQKQGIGRPH